MATLMIDSHYRSLWQKILVDPGARLFLWLRIKPNHITLMAICLGLLCVPAMYFKLTWLALFLIVSSGLLDAIDGTVARRLNQSSDFGSVLDITGDRLVEFSIVIGLYLYDPQGRALPLLILLGSFYLCITTFLLSGIFEKNRSHKSFHYSPGLIERAETFLYFPAVIIFESSFLIVTIIFSALVFFTAFNRLLEMRRFFSRSEDQPIFLTNHKSSDRATKR